MRSTRLETAALGIATLIAGVVLSRFWTLSVADDWVQADAGLILNTSQWLLEDKLPWRDFGYWFGPLAPVLHAGAFAVFGLRESALRMLGAAALAATAGGTYAVGRRELGRAPAAAAALLTWALLLRCLNIQYANVYCVPLAIWALQLAAVPGSRGRAFWAGALGGLAFAFKFNAGGAVLATIWMVLLGPRESTPLPARRRWLDPFWLCLAAFLVAIPLLTRGPGVGLTRTLFPVAALVGCVPMAAAAVRGREPPTAGAASSARWRQGGWLLGGLALAQTSWVVYYAPKVSMGAFLHNMATHTVGFGRGLHPTPVPLPSTETVLVMVAFVLMLLPFLWLFHRVVAALALVGSAIWYLRPLWTPVTPQQALLWDNLGSMMPWFVLGAMSWLAWPRAGTAPHTQTWLRHLALALGCQAIVIYPVGDFGHMIYVAPYFMLGLVWLVVRGGRVAAEVTRVPWWTVAAGAVVPLLVVFVELEQRARPWVRASFLAEGTVPPAIQIAPPRADVWAPRIDAEAVRAVYDILETHPAVHADRLLSYPSPYFYWLTGTTSPPYLPYFWPRRGLPSDDHVEVEHLMRTPPELIAWRVRNQDGLLLADQLRVAYPSAAAYIRDHYGIWQTIPPYHLLLPKDRLAELGRAPKTP